MAEYKMCPNADMAIYILEFIKRGYEKNYKDTGVQKYLEALQMGIDALTTVNRQKAEIERLQNEIGREFICFVGNPHKVEKCPYLEEIGTAKSEARKEFVKRFIKDLSHMITYDKDYIKAKANKLLEEMERENNV